MNFTSLWKPKALDRLLSRHMRTRRKKKTRDEEVRAVRERKAKIREEVYARDRGRCRAFGVPVFLRSADPLKLAHAHHVTYASAGGSDEPYNRVTLSPKAHAMIHPGPFATQILEVSGDGNRTVTFTLKHIETGRIERSWESVCPS